MSDERWRTAFTCDIPPIGVGYQVIRSEYVDGVRIIHEVRLLSASLTHMADGVVTSRDEPSSLHD